MPAKRIEEKKKGHCQHRESKRRKKRLLPAKRNGDKVTGVMPAKRTEEKKRESLPAKRIEEKKAEVIASKEN